jgi:DHA1 family bicyclomycin/chloramphenicol resistance-like MFS transporter
VSTSDAAAERAKPGLDSVPLIVLLSFVFGIAAFATDMYLPAFPAIRATFDVAPQSVQLSMSVFLYGNALGHLVFGPLSDRYGRKPVLIGGLLAYAGASFGCALAPDISGFLTLRALQGAAAASGPVLVRALINDRLPRERAAQTLALLTGTMAFTAMLTPSLGGWLVQAYPWQWIFYGLGIAAVVLVGLCSAGIPESLPATRRLHEFGPRSVFRAYLGIARSARFWSYVLPPSFMFAGVFAYAAVNSFLLIDELGIAERYYGLSYSVAACAYVTGSLAGRTLVRVAGIDRAIVTGLALGFACALAAVLASALAAPLSIALVMIPGICMFFSAALILPIGFSVAVSLFPLHGGSASALAGFTQLGFAGVSAGIAASLYDKTTLPLHVFTFTCCATAAACWFAGRRFRHA